LLLGGVGGKKGSRSTTLEDAIDPGLAALNVSPEHGHFSAGLGKPFCQRAAQHTGRANNDGHFTR
jgi:hypothetical protein